MKPRIQIIDDNVAMTTMLAKALAKSGYDTVVENNPLLAVNTVRHFMPDLILLDVIMPELDGGRVLMDLRNDLSLRYIPVVLLTAIAPEAQALANLGGIQSLVLAKPVQLQELISVIESQLRSSANRHQLSTSASGFNPALSHSGAPILDQRGISGVRGFSPAPVSPPSTNFGGGYPARPSNPGGFQSPLPLPDRRDAGTLPG